MVEVCLVVVGCWLGGGFLLILFLVLFVCYYYIIFCVCCWSVGCGEEEGNDVWVEGLGGMGSGKDLLGLLVWLDVCCWVEFFGWIVWILFVYFLMVLCFFEFFF